MRTSKKAFVSHNKRQRHNFLCGTTLVPRFARHSSARYRAHPVRSTSLLGFGALLRGDKHPGFLCCLAPSGSSLKRIVPSSCPRPGIAYWEKIICGWGRSSGQTAGSGWQSGLWWYRSWDAWALPWEQCPQWSPPGPPHCGRSHRPRCRCHSAWHQP